MAEVHPYDRSAPVERDTHTNTHTQTHKAVMLYTLVPINNV